MKKIYRNPGAWLSVAMFFGLSYIFFRNFPVTAGVLYGGVILYIILSHVHSIWRLRKHGYRVRWYGRDSFFYEEIEAGQVRSLMLYGELMTRGPRHIYFPEPDDWQHKTPEWARNRRDEIVDRIIGELGTKRFRYYNAKH